MSCGLPAKCDAKLAKLHVMPWSPAVPAVPSLNAALSVFLLLRVVQQYQTTELSLTISQIAPTAASRAASASARRFSAALCSFARSLSASCTWQCRGTQYLRD